MSRSENISLIELSQGQLDELISSQGQQESEFELIKQIAEVGIQDTKLAKGKEILEDKNNVSGIYF